MCLLGGLGTPLGPIIGAILVVTLESRLSGLGTVQVGSASVDLSTKVPIIIGLIFMVCVLLFRRGIVGEIAAAFDAARARRKPSPENSNAAKRVDIVTAD
jgi:branched-chain amino acid transport system permease protein